MLTWKIFVIIMSLTSLTLVNVNSSGNRQPGTPRRRGRPPIQRTSGEASSSVPRGRRPLQENEEYINLREIVLYDPNQEDVSRRHFPVMYNTFNPLSDMVPGSVCYKQIRVFCDNEPNNSQSNNCIRKAIINYKNSLWLVIDDDYEELLSQVRDFFANFPINTGNFSLPIPFCIQKANDLAQRSQFYSVINEYADLLTNEMKPYVDMCLDDLRDYQAFITTTLSMENMDPVELSNARYTIAMYALNSKSIIGMESDRRTFIDNGLRQILYVLDVQLPNFQIHYLNEIANNVTSASPQHNPGNYCRAVQAEQDRINREAKAKSMAENQAKDRRLGRARFR